MSKRELKYSRLFGVLTLVIMTLFFACAQQQATLLDEEYSGGDDDFQNELLGMLNLSEDELGQDSDFLNKLDQDTNTMSAQAAGSSSAQDDESLDDVLSLLLEDDTPAFEEFEDQDVQTPMFQADEPSSNADNRLKTDVQQLENVYEKKRMQADSLRRKLEEKNARIRLLESQEKSAASAVSGSAKSLARTSGQELTDVPGNSPYNIAYRDGRQQFEKADYNGAIKAFQNLLANTPNHSLSDNCQYWIGESYFGLKQYQQAIIEFQKVFAYNQTDKHDDAQLMVAISYVKSGQNDKARSEFQKFTGNYPNSEYMRVAQRYLSKL
ncbi:MAG TPA: tetratricopeptide repeat protein [bacterium]|nr:tetratricopeptide repeat protein [bacterium]HPN42406.1 tetratricopeptide repeat protein [bacterium]